MVVVLIGKPGGDYDIASERVFKFIQHLGNSEPFTRGETQHLRGKFPAVNAGISLGPGCTFPSRVGVGSHDEMVEKLLNNKDVQRLASHQDGTYFYISMNLDFYSSYSGFQTMAPQTLRPL